MSPHVVEDGTFASTGAGRALQANQLQQNAKKAAGAILAVAILQAVFGTILLVIAANQPGADQDEMFSPAVFVFVYGLAALFFGLFLWARKNPLPAAICALVLFVSVHLLDAVVDPASIVRGILVKIIIIVILVRAIRAGVAHRQLREASTS